MPGLARLAFAAADFAGRQRLQRLAHGRLQFEIDRLERELAQLDFGKVEGVIDDRQQMIAAAAAAKISIAGPVGLPSGVIN